MEAVYEKIETAPEVSWRSHIRRAGGFDFHWHFHPEHELTLITRGTGRRFVGDCIEEYGPGDLVLTGPDLPHTYASDSLSAGAEAVVIQFRPDFLGRALFAGPDLAPIGRVLADSSAGLAFPGDRPPVIDEKLSRICDRPGPERTLDLLEILLQLSQSQGRRLASPSYSPIHNHASRDRLDSICRFLHARYAQPVTLAEIAGAAHLSPAACSRFFRRAMGRTLTAYLTELRIGAACRMLLDTDRPVGEIATACGYQNLANFNRRFRELKATTPMVYRVSYGGARV